MFKAELMEYTEELEDLIEDLRQTIDAGDLDQAREILNAWDAEAEEASGEEEG